MRHLICLESSTKDLGLAFFKDGVLIEDLDLSGSPRTHSERILPEIDALLKRNELTIDQIDAMAFSIGPGSFTSLRVGYATILGFGLITPLQVYGVSSLQALALQAKGQSSSIMPLLLSGRGRVHAALFEVHEGKFKTIGAETSIPEEEVLEWIDQNPSVLCVGPGCAVLPESLKVAKLDCRPRALDLGQWILQGNQQPTPLETLRIAYNQEPDIG